ncbi:hypothetical protein PC119_g8620 [Phytophthora cactorum]|nr:hypothetical protein PC114_g7836 [Phytophthora cactorum]KAG3024166.1 hypothetical protein PC119_g8620 [Phytophthora cactorum]KAG3177829.1 hypothetical protein C6341_g8262 [Phytophthora cactorum]
MTPLLTTWCNKILLARRTFRDNVASAKLNKLDGGAQPCSLRSRNVLRHETERARTRRANLTASQRGRTRRIDIERQRSRRAQQSERDRDRADQEERWASQTEEEWEALQERNRLRHQESRALIPPDEQAQRERLRRSDARRGHAHHNHEDFDASMATDPNVVDGRHRLPRTTVCEHCNAWKWPAETKTSCCLEGAVKLPALPPAPTRLLQLYKDPEFRKHIRAYNHAFAFTSIGASCNNRSTFQPVNQDESVAGQHGVYTFRIQGAMGHYLGSLLPYTDQITNQPVTPKFAQIYIVDPDMQQRATRRRGIFSDLCPVALGDIESMMAEHNPLAQQFLTFGERLPDLGECGGDIVDVRFRLHENRSRPGTYNLPTESEVGATMIEDGNLAQPRDIILYAKDHRLFRLFETHATYDPLQYPLLLPYGELGWTYTDTYDGDIVRRNKREMSLREHVAYRLYHKCDDQSVLHQGGRLFQLYCVDQQAKCEQEQLRWVAAHQSEIRADLYSGLNDSLMNESTTVLGEEEDLLSEYNRSTRTLQHPDQPRHRDNHFLNQIGKRVILPSSHSGAHVPCTSRTKTR